MSSLFFKLHNWLGLGGKRLVLLVDDEPGILATLGAILELHDLEVVTATSGEAARQLLQSARFDLVITDMKMESDTAGYKVVEAARQSPGHPATLIISGCSGLVSDWEARGADAMLTKPTHTPELLAIIDGLLMRPPHPKPREVQTEAA